MNSSTRKIVIIVLLFVLALVGCKDFFHPGGPSEKPSEYVKIYGTVKLVSIDGGAWYDGYDVTVELKKRYSDGRPEDMDTRRYKTGNGGTVSWEIILKRADIQKYSHFHISYGEWLPHSGVSDFTISDDQEEINFGSRIYFSYISGTIKNGVDLIYGSSLIFSRDPVTSVQAAKDFANGLYTSQGEVWLDGQEDFRGALELESASAHPPTVYFILADWDKDEYKISPAITIIDTDDGGGAYGYVGDLDCAGWTLISGGF
ncbi:hypothetical protein AGMMS49928_12900 [Spirochaetia bacterium]|nr:hypothetical protein AGMMS49928_12900 [Spirochaetia bacterium]